MLTELSRPSGLPSASTICPCFNSLESPNFKTREVGFFDLHDGEVAIAIDAYDPALNRPVERMISLLARFGFGADIELDLHFVRAAHYVGIGQECSRLR